MDRATGERAGATALGTAALVGLVTHDWGLAILTAVGAGAAATVARPSRRDPLDVGGDRQAVLQADPLVNYVPTGTTRVDVAASPAWAKILEGGNGKNAWVQRRLRIVDDGIDVLEAFAVEGRRLDWLVEDDGADRLTCSRPNGRTSDLVTVQRAESDLTVIATVVD